MARPFRFCSVLFVAALGLSSLACTRVKVEEVRGPGGGEWKAISCSRMNAKCFKTAQHMCPNGYVFARAQEASSKSSADAKNGSAQAASNGNEPQITTLPPQEEWRSEMYSKKPGKLLVRCASSPPKLTAQN